MGTHVKPPEHSRNLIMPFTVYVGITIPTFPQFRINGWRDSRVIAVAGVAQDLAALTTNRRKRKQLLFGLLAIPLSKICYYVLNGNDQRGVQF